MEASQDTAADISGLEQIQGCIHYAILHALVACVPVGALICVYGYFTDGTAPQENFMAVLFAAIVARQGAEIGAQRYVKHFGAEYKGLAEGVATSVGVHFFWAFMLLALAMGIAKLTFG